MTFYKCEDCDVRWQDDTDVCWFCGKPYRPLAYGSIMTHGCSATIRQGGTPLPSYETQ